jgi:16S rRNA (adenine1518-N6/adenine1519-N6)-dimethyltransferase
LVSRRALDAIVSSARLSADDSVVEIGAGLGTLTQALALAAGFVTAVELDRRLLPALATAVEGSQNVRIVPGDALEVDAGTLFGGPADAIRKFVANLPYNVAAPVLLRFLDPGLRVRRLVVTVQREVAERIVAAPGSAAYGRLSVAVQFRADARVVQRIPPGAFWPPPEVESAVAEIVPRPSPAVSVPDEAELARIVAAGFGQRRKTLANALSHGLGVPPSLVALACAASGVDPRARAETLGLDAFGALARALHPLPPAR